MRFAGRGHPAIRATHHKTLELLPGPELTERGTCIVAVDVEPEPVAPMAGRIRIRISAGRERFSLDATANPVWDPTGPVVIRRGPLRLPGTFATDASKAASDLPRELVVALQDPAALVTVDVVAIPDDGPIVVLALAHASDGQPGPALVAELDRADEVIAEDADARRLVGGARRAEHPARTLIVATRELPGLSCPDRLAGVSTDTVGLPAPLAAIAACPSRAPVTVGDDLALVRSAPAGHRLLLRVGRRDLPELLVRAERERGSGAATVVQEFGRPQLAGPDALPDLVGSDDVFCCLHPAPARDTLDPTVRAAVDALLADGVATKTAAKALAALTGWERRRAYAAIVDRARAT